MNVFSRRYCWKLFSFVNSTTEHQAAALIPLKPLFLKPSCPTGDKFGIIFREISAGDQLVKLVVQPPLFFFFFFTVTRTLPLPIKWDEQLLLCVYLLPSQSAVFSTVLSVPFTRFSTNCPHIRKEIKLVISVARKNRMRLKCRTR